VDVSATVRRPGLSFARVRELVTATLESERVRDALVSIAFVGTKTIARLNREFLSHTGRTDVISFALGRPEPSLPVIGDIYICQQIAERNAENLGIPLRAELARLVVHGTLHILGYEHPEGDARFASRMWRKQERILESLH
jgi:probable rRNA maturation factor